MDRVIPGPQNFFWNGCRIRYHVNFGIQNFSGGRGVL